MLVSFSRGLNVRMQNNKKFRSGYLRLGISDSMPESLLPRILVKRDHIDYREAMEPLEMLGCMARSGP